MASNQSNTGFPSTPPPAEQPAPPPSVTPVPGSEDKPVLIRAMERDIVTGRWIESMVPVNEAARLAVEFDPTDAYEEDPGLLGPKWREGRGQYMEGRWVHVDAKWHGRFRTQGFEPVDPAVYKDARFPVRDIPGLGKCNTYGDAVLMEMPKEQYQARRKWLKDQRDKERLERMFGLRESDEEMMRRHRGMVSITRRRDLDMDAPQGNPVQDEINALNRALEFADEQRVLHSRLGYN